MMVSVLVETGLFLTEVLFSIFNAKNKQLRKAESIDDLDFIDLEEGVTTGISWKKCWFTWQSVLLFIF